VELSLKLMQVKMLLVQQLELATSQNQQQKHPLTLVFAQKACTILQVLLA
jgi:hypothetical protein